MKSIARFFEQPRGIGELSATGEHDFHSIFERRDREDHAAHRGVAPEANRLPAWVGLFDRSGREVANSGARREGQLLDRR